MAEVCQTCKGTKTDPAVAIPLAFPQFADHVAAMYPCSTCTPDGRRLARKFDAGTFAVEGRITTRAQHQRDRTVKMELIETDERLRLAGYEPDEKGVWRKVTAI